ncbi:putative Major facilitator superfamily domain-containing protein [Seiridium cardinale]|uniref:Major facilitator superfamily domain-containing protein n=1 Tax=Seiridium cardinale TaxID=138064 RepID=A0ABR2XNX8_9PEZI
MAPALLDISPDLSMVGSRLGMASIFAGLGFLVGPPIAGAIRASSAGYFGESAFAGSTYLLALVVMGLVYRKRTRSAALSRSGGNTSSSEVSLAIEMKVETSWSVVFLTLAQAFLIAVLAMFECCTETNIYGSLFNG